jgi:hypothetical protein
MMRAMSTRSRLTVLAATVVILFAFALIAWAAVYDYGRGTETLTYEQAGGYTCPYSTQTVRARYDGSTIWDSYGTVKFYGNFRDSAGGTVHYHSYTPVGSIDFDQNSRGWNTGHRYMVSIAADPSGLSYYAPMRLAIWCQ